MTLAYSDDWLDVYAGDAREVLATLPAESVDCVVTSPPYWGLRDYGTEGQIGLEPSPDDYVSNLVDVFREVRRVLKARGTCWLNLGDSYGSADGATGRADQPGPRLSARGLKPKDLVGIPWRVAFALQADGWYLRSDIIWAKPNPMPESVTDRPTKSHEYLFLLTKSSRYFFDSDAVREPLTESAIQRDQSPRGRRQNGGGSVESLTGIEYTTALGDMKNNPAGRNIRSVWTIATRPYPGAHFAVFPPELPERCIKAGSPTLGTILDPFAGSGTVGLVANHLSRRAILIDLNPDYITQQMKRNANLPLGLGAA